MDYKNYLAISYYDQIAVLNEAHHVYLVQHKTSKKIFVKKELSVYNKALYEQLKDNPISGLPRIYELCEEDKKLIVIEEYICGDTLEELVEGGKSFGMEEISNYMLQLCDIVMKLHNCNPAIIHRDIKPSNVMLTQSGHIVLLDLNAAKYESFDKAEDTMLLGTKGYAAPEQYGFGASSLQTDIFAMGTLLKYLTCGDINADVEKTNAFSKVIDKSTQLDAKRRYSSVLQLSRAIEKVVAGKGIEAESFVRYHVKQPLGVQQFFPPGFRSNNPIHMILAFLIYLLIIVVSANITVENASPADLLFNKISMGVVLFLTSFFAADYLNVQRFLPYTKHPNIVVRTGFIFVYTCLVFVILVGIVVLFENLFFLS